MKKYVICVAIGIIATLFLGTFSFAQTASFKISGKVIDAQTNAPVVGASIIVQNSKRGASTDVEGRFLLSVEKGKKHTIVVTSIGYSTKTMADIGEANADNITIVLAKKGQDLKEVVVTASVTKRETAAAIYSLQKNSSSISDGISAEAIRRSPDKNTGEVIKRVSGASIQDNKFVIIRGMNERYNVSMLNNAILPSTEPDKKAFSFDIIPSSLVDNLIIYKSPTPDLPGDFAGGAVKITTKDYPAKKISDLNVSISYNSITTNKNFYGGLPNGSLDFIGFYDKQRNVPGFYYANKDKFSLLDNATKIAATKQFRNNFGYEILNKSLPNISLGYTGGNTKLMNNGNKLGYIYSLNYATGRKITQRERDEYDFTGFNNYKYNTVNYDAKNNLSALLNLAYSYKRSKISLKNLFNNDFTKTLALRDNGFVDPNNGPTSRFNVHGSNSEASTNGIANSVLEGTHKLNKGFTIDWNASYALTYRWQPDQRIINFSTTAGGIDNYRLVLSNENSPQIKDAGRIYSFLKENIIGGNINVTKEFNWLGYQQKLKFGTSNYYRSRDVEVVSLGYASTNPFGVPIPESKDVSVNNIFSDANIDKYGIIVSSIATLSTNYTGKNALNAGYVMLDNKFNEKVKLTWGVRVENFSQEIVAKNKAKVNPSNFDVLPSLLFTYGLNKKTNIRVAASQSVNRPEFRELVDFSVYDFDNNFFITGNPRLERCKNTSADIRYEYFPTGGEIVSASIFYKNFIKPIEQTNQSNGNLTYQNAENANTYGIELEVRKKLDFLNNDFFNHFIFYTNAAYIKGNVGFSGFTSSVPLQGQSPYLINSGLTYTTTNDDLSFNILYNRIGPRLRFRSQLGGALNTFEKPRDLIDFQVSKKFNNNKLEVKLTISDILAQPFAWYYKYDADDKNLNFDPSKDKIINSFKYGTTATLALKYSLGK